MNAPFRCQSLLVLGGARSGKSRHAQGLAESSGLERLYLATGEARDAEMAARIAQHRADRGPDWQTREEPLELAAALRQVRAPGRVVLVDCLTLWLTNAMLAGRDLVREIAGLAEEVSRPGGPLVLVSNEVGMGIAPATPMGREFRDWQGRANQDIAAVCEGVVFVAAGLPIRLKPGSDPGIALG